MTHKLISVFGSAVMLMASAPTAHAAVIVDGSKVASGSVTGTLVAIDVPFNNSTGASPVFGGPDWADDADDGFTAPLAAGDGIRGPMSGISKWEPDGTPVAEAIAYFTFGNGPAPSVVWDFSAAASGIDIPDGAVINAIYATWNTRNVDGITYEYTEGAASGSIVRQQGGAAPSDDLQLNWTDADSNVRTGDFERIFTGPIIVTGGDGFQLWGTDNIGNAAHIDAVVLDISGISACSPGDTDGDGDIDTGDLTTAITNFTGAGGSGKTCADGDTDDDGDVDTGDLTFSITNFTGAQAGNAGVPDLIYDPATGEVTIDADGADVISFSLQSGPFNAADFSELPAGLTDNIASQIGWTSFNLFSGLTGTANLGAILPAGLDLAGLEAALTTASYGLALAGGGGGGRLDLIIPEPTSLLLMGLGAMVLLGRKQAASMMRVPL